VRELQKIRIISFVVNYWLRQTGLPAAICRMRAKRINLSETIFIRFGKVAFTIIVEWRYGTWRFAMFGGVRRQTGPRF